MIQTIDTIDYKEIKDYYLSIEETLVWNEISQQGKQSNIQFIENEDPWTSGKRKDMRDPSIFCALNPFFINSVIEKLVIKFDLVRTRFMWLNSVSCYTMHKDTSPRIHIPIITNPRCYFLFNDESPIHLEEGKVYWVDTRKEHTAMNCSFNNRLHIVGAVK